jgi:deazaflavin-dependent oxidoreductase (nitroreductase family)
MNFFRRLFWVFNKFFMVPMFRLGFGPFMGNPITGYIMVLKTIGRKTGKIRFTPVIYTIMGGNVYCIAGFGKISHWYLNLKADPNLEVILPSGAIAGVAEDVSDPDESLIAFRRMLKSGGFSGFFEGYNPFRASDERMRAAAPATRRDGCG